MPVADFDGDGVQDVAMYEQATGVTPAKLLFASGVLNGSGGAQHSCQVNGIARGFAAADLLRAGHAQLVVLTRDAVDGGPTGAAYARLITFDGSGYTQTQQWFVDAGSDGVSAGDFDGDGNADLAFTSQQHADPVWLWFGDGTGSFPHQVMVDVTDLSFAVFPVYVSATAGRGIVVDGASSFHTLVPRDAGYVTAPTGFGFVPNSNGGHHMVSADLDGDGLTDLLSGDYGGPGATALKWWRAGPTGYVQSDFAGEATPGVAVVDIDNDNILDVVTLETRSSAGWAGLRVRKGHR
jgi:hypothetical protein